jgi:hypothetical protein
MAGFAGFGWGDGACVECGRRVAGRALYCDECAARRRRFADVGRQREIRRRGRVSIPCSECGRPIPYRSGGKRGQTCPGKCRERHNKKRNDAYTLDRAKRRFAARPAVVCLTCDKALPFYVVTGRAHTHPGKCRDLAQAALRVRSAEKSALARTLGRPVKKCLWCGDPLPRSIYEGLHRHSTTHPGECRRLYRNRLDIENGHSAHKSAIRRGAGDADPAVERAWLRKLQRHVARYGWRCCYCWRTVRAGTLHPDHFERIAKGTHHVKNLVPCCDECNNSKNRWGFPALASGGTVIRDRVAKHFTGRLPTTAAGVLRSAYRRWNDGE